VLSIWKALFFEKSHQLPRVRHSAHLHLIFLQLLNFSSISPFSFLLSLANLKLRPFLVAHDTTPLPGSSHPPFLPKPKGLKLKHKFRCQENAKKMGIYVLTGSGTVANVTLYQPSPAPGATVTFHGRFDILQQHLIPPDSSGRGP
jgi:hypothetical protein